VSADLIASTARAAMTELRRLLGVLRFGAPEDPERKRLTPVPSMTRLAELVEAVRDAGLPVTCHVSGPVAELPPGVDLTAYRILQEALTNAVKHASGSPTAVHLRVGADTIGLAVETAAEPGTGTGVGVISMRERAEALGGSCQAGPGGQGWLVRATLPGPGSRPGAAAT
jgi:signal transduction histidine kinase